MIPVTLNGAEVWLVNHPPDWTTPPSLRLEVPSAQERGLTGRESRRSLGNTLRTRLRWAGILQASELASFLAGLKAMGDDPVVVPVWPLAVCPETTSPAPIVDGLLVAWRTDAAGQTEWALDDAIGDPMNWDFIAPAIHGYFETTPEPTTLNPELSRVEFAVREDGPIQYALSPPDTAWDEGPALPDASAVLVFPWPVNWSQPALAGSATYEIDRQEIGPGRQAATAYYEQGAERPVQALLTLTTVDDVADFLAWWLRQGGDVAAHWAPAQIQSVRLAADALVGATTLTITPEAGWGPDTYAIGLSRSYGPVPEYVRVISVVGGLVSLETPLDSSWDRDETVLLPLILARHAAPSIDLEFVTPEVANATVAWREVAAETLPAASEDRGETLGRVPERAWLYTLDVVRDGVSEETHRVTSYERDVRVDISGSPSVFYDARPIDHTEVRQTVRMDREEVTLTLRWWPDCPLRLFLPGALTAKVEFRIEHGPVVGDAIDSAELQTVFSGQITSASFDGPFISAPASSASRLFDRQVPTLLMSRVCNWHVYDRGCQLLKTDWTFSATVISVTGTTLVLGTFSRPAGLPLGFGFQGWFALGTLMNAGGERAFIVRSDALNTLNGRIEIEVDRPVAVVASDLVELIPGCDGREETCRPYPVNTGAPTPLENIEGKFNNFVRFGGFPKLPSTSPQLQPSPIQNAGSGKK